FEWVDFSDHENGVIAYLRKGRAPEDSILAVLNVTPVPRSRYRVGVPAGGYWRELLNSDAPEYGGSGQGNLGGVEADPLPMHGRGCSLSLTLPPLAMVLFKRNSA
ncbi:MAG TPA: alpha amylase C-terminal domain-containing protein, partial [Nitrospirota bacterium]|nr:alpha amylase C-terminal domain-containing protein [Nitrospirota bacterium]